MGLTTLYPRYGLKSVQEQQGSEWYRLVDRLGDLPMGDTQVMAFAFVMRRLRSFLGMEIGSCRDTLCSMCAEEVLEQFPGTEAELMSLYDQALEDIESRVNRRTVRFRSRRIAAIA